MIPKLKRESPFVEFWLDEMSLGVIRLMARESNGAVHAVGHIDEEGITLRTLKLYDTPDFPLDSEGHIAVQYS